MAHMNSGPGCADAVLLQTIDEDAFTENLKVRFAANEIYTYIGEVVVSMNPYADVGLYTNDILKGYRGVPLYQKPPHIFGVAEAAFTALRRTQEDVCVVISGESGAGKTEASKLVMRYLAATSEGGHQEEIVRIKNMLLASTPLLETFGNARTTRNDNSSRFGKYMDVNFDQRHAPLGGHIRNYLLEKARVIGQEKGERNFHIFYQLLAGADDGTLGGLALTRDASSYRYLNGGGDVAVGSDKEQFHVFQKAMDDIGLAELKEPMIALVAAVILIGQIEFADNADGESCAITNQAIVDSVAKALKVDAAALTKSLTTRTVATRNEVFESPSNSEKSRHAADALAKAVYDRMFTYLVTQINKSIEHTDTGGVNMVLGVLDIYGFEIFGVNGFEQFCINYCNEKLQQLFIEVVMKREQEEYRKEGIDWVEITFFDNAAICAMVDGKQGIIAMLDDECFRPKGNNEGFQTHIDQTLKGNDRYQSFGTEGGSSGCERNVEFRIRHFAGDVVYNNKGFVEKNNDQLFHDLKRMLYGSERKELQEMWPEGADTANTVHKNPITAATGFKQSMEKLTALLLEKNPFYIRCIKPNNEKAKLKFDEELVRHQIRYLGLLENLRVRRAGYCNRQLYEDFATRYKMLAEETWPNYRGGAQAATQTIIDKFGMKEGVAFGNTKLFIKEPTTLIALEMEREKVIPILVTKVQSFYRGYLARRRVRRMRAVYTIVAFFHKAQMRSYSQRLLDTFKDVNTKPDFGKSLEWPKAPVGLSSFVLYGKKIHLNWWARKVYNKYSPEERDELEKKSLASKMLQGRRKYWGYNYSWDGNYIVKGTHARKFGDVMIANFDKNGDNKILFSSHVRKLTSKGKQVNRVLVVTDKFMYKLEDKSFKVHKPPLPLQKISGFAISSGEDQACLIKMEGEDDVVVSLVGEPCCAELISIVAQAVGKDLPVEVDTKVRMKIHGNERSLTFSDKTDKKTHFAKRPSGYALVTRKQSMMQLQARRPTDQ